MKPCHSGKHQPSCTNQAEQWQREFESLAEPSHRLSAIFVHVILSRYCLQFMALLPKAGSFAHRIQTLIRTQSTDWQEFQL
jgi:hypothetical protein